MTREKQLLLRDFSKSAKKGDVNTKSRKEIEKTLARDNHSHKYTHKHMKDAEEMPKNLLGIDPNLNVEERAQMFTIARHTISLMIKGFFEQVFPIS